MREDLAPEPIPEETSTTAVATSPQSDVAGTGIETVDVLVAAIIVVALAMAVMTWLLGFQRRKNR